VLERAMTTRSEPPTIGQIDVLAEPPAPHRGRVLVEAAVVVLLVTATVVGLVWEGRRNPPSSPTPAATAIANGRIAFSASGDDDESDIYLVREGSSPRRIAGSDTDTSEEVCPAFSPDGTRLAFGQATGNSEDGYSGDGAIVITDLSADGVQTATTTIALEGMPDPPCAIWSADGRWLAFGVRLGVGTSRRAGQVWVVDTESDDIRRLTELDATDLEWAPDAAELAIADHGVVLYSVTADETRPLGSAGAESVDWSPDGRTIAFFTRNSPNVGTDHHGFWIMDADGSDERVLVEEVDALHGLGPLWSPDGDRIAYQRRTTFCPLFDGSCSEETEVVLLTVNSDDPLEPAGSQVVIPPPQTAGPDGPLWWYPNGVAWSPDGTTLLYYAWAEPADLADLEITNAIPNGIVAVALDGETPPVVLSGALGAGVYSGYPWLPFQSWGRQPAG
jgi:Tol biopolymer transport system component